MYDCEERSRTSRHSQRRKAPGMLRSLSAAWLKWDVRQRKDAGMNSLALIIITVVIGLICAPIISRAVLKRWPKKGKWGIPKSPSACSVCGTAPRPLRVPANKHQMLWGGWTCKKCGSELDKYGSVIPSPHEEKA